MSLKPDLLLIKQHLDFIYSDLSAYDDGRFEIGGLVSSNTENFSLSDIDAATNKAAQLNEKNTNTYFIPAILNPDIAPFGRASDTDIYATNVLWLDIDEAHDAEQLKALYAHCPPNLAVKTATIPHRRIHLYWKLDEPITDHDTIREALAGLIQNLKGDPAAVNPSRLMRVAGTVNYPNPKKKAEGRVNELVTLHFLDKDKRYNIEQIMAAYPVRDYVSMNKTIESSGVITRNISQNPFSEPLVDDGRDLYMSHMVFAAIVSLTQANGAWPTAQEVFDDVWPIYSRKVAARGGRSLDQDGRGQKALAQKIRSKLRQFINGGMARYGFNTLEETVFKKSKEDSAGKSGKTEENQENKKQEEFETFEDDIKFSEPKKLPLLFASDITAITDTTDFVQGLLCEKQFSVIYGPSNCGKTFFMLDLAMHVALGRKWRNKAVEQGGVIYAALEGGHGTRNRIVAFKEHYQITEEIPLAVIPAAVNLSNETTNDVPFLIEAIERAKVRIGNIKLIIIDTLSRAISGGDENSSVDMGRLIIAADSIRAITGAHIAFIHHSGKDDLKGARGHSSLRAAVDTEIEISRYDPHSPSKVKIVKQREMEMADDMEFKLEQIILGVNKRQEDIASCIVIPTEVTEIIKKPKLTAIQQFVYDAIVQSIYDSGILRSIIKDMPSVKCISYDEMKDALELRGYKEVMATEDKTTAQQIKSSTQAARVALKKHGKINFNGAWIWLTEEEGI